MWRCVNVVPERGIARVLCCTGGGGGENRCKNLCGGTFWQVLPKALKKVPELDTVLGVYTKRRGFTCNFTDLRVCLGSQMGMRAGHVMKWVLGGGLVKGVRFEKMMDHSILSNPLGWRRFEK